LARDVAIEFRERFGSALFRKLARGIDLRNAT
jgi:hypothetical protein